MPDSTMPDSTMPEPKIAPNPIIPIPPPLPKLVVSPAASSVSISSGQQVTIEFGVERIDAPTTATLAVGSLPAGITATFSPPSLAYSATAFSLTLTAASNITPVLATIQVTVATDDAKAQASVTVNAKALGQVFPAYHILTVIYAPPGMNGGKSGSQVVYGSQSTTGTIMSTTSSFKAGVDVTASLGVNVGPVSLGASAEFTASQTASETSSINVNKSTGTQLTVVGPDQDGILHGNDIVVLFLNPEMIVGIDYQDNLVWELGVNGETMLIQYVYIDWLLTPSLMPPGVAQALAAAGITTADYAQIAEADPFYSDSSPTANGTIDPNRFVPTPFSFAYEPPEASGDPIPAMTYSQTTTTTVTGTEQVQIQYGVTCTVSAGLQGPFSAAVKVAGSLEFTDTATATTSTGSTQAASVTVGGPAYGYTGPTDIIVYWDTVFNSFMFAFATGTPTVSGTITGSGGLPAVGEAVTLAIGGVTLTTFTGSNGQYSFYNTAPGQGQISVGTQTATVTVPVNEVAPPVNVTI
jgi:hypothetical protein